MKQKIIYYFIILLFLITGISCIKSRNNPLDPKSINYIESEDIITEPEYEYGVGKTWTTKGEFIADENTVALWHFNGNASDVSGNNLDAYTNSAILTNGVFKEGYFFMTNNSSVTTIIEIPDNDLIDLTNNFTIEFWIKPKVQIGNSRRILNKGIMYIVCINADNSLYFSIYTNNNGWDANTSSLQLQTNTYYYIVCTFKNGVSSLYINGEINVQENLGTNAKILPSTYPLLLGDNGTHSRQYYGFLDELRISSTVRTSEEILAYWNYIKNNNLSP